ncbi:hypothetical protein N7533_005367 [Penicillium manginii]|uniref:uncharacterized protein n=1 Tax=Penicillium manginii TaxID=203109 RepID=UPI002548A736|nr:uncharacterized protein N7533_005367 [Penicillium manginii]KAJ5755824.1 hypothetical protein N7533_005367 [Penicillium manginii]
MISSPAPSDCAQKRSSTAGMPSQTDPPTDHHEDRDEPNPGASTIIPDSTSSYPNCTNRTPSPEGQRPPLPPRPNTLSLLNDEASPRAPTLQAEATTAVSREDAGPQTPNAGKVYSSLAVRGLSRGLKARASLSQLTSPKGSDAGDSASIRSSIQNGDLGDVDAMFSDFVVTVPTGPADTTSLLHFPEFPADNVNDEEFLDEFNAVGELDELAGNEGSSTISFFIGCSGSLG